VTRVVRSIPPFDHEGGHTDVHSVSRRHARRLADQLHAPGLRRRQANGGGQPSAAPLELPRCPRRLREGTGKLARGMGSVGARKASGRREGTELAPMSDPAGWYTSSVTPNAASPAIFSDICSAVPVNAMELANGMSSATCGSSRGLASIMWPAWMARCRSLSGYASIASRHARPVMRRRRPRRRAHSWRDTAPPRTARRRL
jgi:hypothetical protein